MPRARIAVLVPGILGSVLQDSAGGVIWSDNFYKNYKTLLKNPGLLSWKGVKANAHLLKTARFSLLNLMALWSAVESVSYPSDFHPTSLHIGYDWRQSNVDSASDLADRLTSVVGSSVSIPPSKHEERRLTFIMHSMGGIVVRIAIANRLIDLGWIDRLIHIGSPLYGAPAAFNTLFGSEIFYPYFLSWWRPDDSKIAMRSSASYRSAYKHAHQFMNYYLENKFPIFTILDRPKKSPERKSS